MKPFEGVKVVDLSTVIAASSAARILADQKVYTVYKALCEAGGKSCDATIVMD